MMKLHGSGVNFLLFPMDLEGFQCKTPGGADICLEALSPTFV